MDVSVPLVSLRRPGGLPVPQVWEPEQYAETGTESIRHRHNLSPYAGMRLKGRVMGTAVGGNWMSLSGALPPKPCGNLIYTKPPRGMN